MRKNTLLFAVLLTLNGCAEINQPLESLSSKLKDLGDKIKHGDNRAETTVAPQKKNMPTLATASQVTNKSDTPSIEATTEPVKKPTPLNIAIPKEVKSEPVQETIVKPKPAEITPPPTPKAVLAKEIKPEPLIEHISLSELNRHNWQINKILLTSNFTTNEDRWLFSFDKTGKYKAFGACNYLTGKFNASDDGTFRLGKLETSLNDCPESKDEEVMVFNMLLMADSFALRGDTLLLKSGDKVMMELIASKQDINVMMAKKVHGKKDKKETKAKGPKKKSQKNGQPKVSQPSNQKHSQSNHKKKK
jgi:heat shock protein HslJ